MSARQLSILPSVRRTAKLSDDGRYRYTLGRCWDESRRDLTWILLNPSTADSLVDDPTVRRCIGYAKRWGYGGIVIVNLFAMRTASPIVLRCAAKAGWEYKPELYDSPVGPDNDAHICEAISNATKVVAAWGNHGSLLGRDEAVTRLAQSFGVALWCLKKTKLGQPSHPLRLPYDLELQPFRSAARAARSCER